MTVFARLVAIVPVRSLEGAKSRLGESLDPEERQELVLALVRRTIRAARAAPSVERVVVVSEDQALLDAAAEAGAATLLQDGEGLNEGLDQARSAAGRADALLVLPADLPNVGEEEIERIVAEAEASRLPRRPVVALVPDRRGTGTNVLLVAPPDAVPFRFGEGSRRLHAAEAERAGAVYVEIGGPLAFDLDTPDDLLLADMSGLGHEAGR